MGWCRAGGTQSLPKKEMPGDCSLPRGAGGQHLVPVPALLLVTAKGGHVSEVLPTPAGTVLSGRAQGWVPTLLPQWVGGDAKRVLGMGGSCLGSGDKSCCGTLGIGAGTPPPPQHLPGFGCCIRVRRREEGLEGDGGQTSL